MAYRICHLKAPADKLWQNFVREQTFKDLHKHGSCTDFEKGLYVLVAWRTHYTHACKLDAKYDSICACAVALAMSRASFCTIHLSMGSLLPKWRPGSSSEHLAQLCFGP